MSQVIIRQSTLSDALGIQQACSAGAKLQFEPLGLTPEQMAGFLDKYYQIDRVKQEIVPAQSPQDFSGYQVANDNVVIVGAIAGGMVDAATSLVWVLMLDPARRGQGIGTKLLNHLTAQHKSFGATKQQVHVFADNHYGLPFYQARGFIEIERRPFSEDHPFLMNIKMERPI
jgi:GNAT superfamily N-acetyltransferase